MHNNYITELYGTINNINGGVRNDLHVLCVDLLTMSEYCINKHLTSGQAEAAAHRRCENTNARCVLPGTHYNV